MSVKTIRRNDSELDADEFVIIDGSIPIQQELDYSCPKPVLAPRFEVGDLVIPLPGSAFAGQQCRVTKAEGNKVYATLTKWNKVPSWPFKARELEYE